MKCECHSKSMFWVNDTRKKDGGYWSCKEKRKERERRWNQANPEKRREARARRVFMVAAGIPFYIGSAPTVEAADYLRKKIKEEAPK